MLVTGEIREDSRSKFGYEIGITNVEVVSESHDYPITPKEHGTDFLMDHRHLWLRSSRQHAIMQIRNEIIRATYEFFNQHHFVKIDPPILTGSAPEGTTDLFETNYFDQKLIYLKVANYTWKLLLWLSEKSFHSVRLSVLKNQNTTSFD